MLKPSLALGRPESNSIMALPVASPGGVRRGSNNVIFFAGEGTHANAGATAHAALETGIRAAAEVSAELSSSKKSRLHFTSPTAPVMHSKL